MHHSGLTARRWFIIVYITKGSVSRWCANDGKTSKTKVVAIRILCPLKNINVLEL